MSRSAFVPLSAFILLDHACEIVSDAFGHPPYHVGSSTQHADWRDVDVRLMLPDDEFADLFGDLFGSRRHLWSLLCLTTSEHLSHASGLPVDFQVQRVSQANEEYGGEFRNPLGLGGNMRRLYAGGPPQIETKETQR